MALFGAAVVAVPPADRVFAQFRSGTALVVVDAVVTRPDGELVSDLTVGDFELSVDGKPRPIEQFRLVDARQTPAAAETPEGVASNAAEPGGVFAIVIDELNLGNRGAMLAQDQAIRFLQQTLQPHDYATVLRSGTTSALLFSNQPERLVAVARGTGGMGGSSGGRTPEDAISAADSNSAELTSADGFDPADADTGGRHDATGAGLVMLRLAVERLAVIPSRRKAVIWFSEGLGIDVRAQLANPTDRAGDRLREVLRAAFEGNVAIYPVDPRGLSTAPNLSRFRRAVPGGAELDALRDVATITGGRAIVNTNDVPTALGEVARENRAYYLLGYATSGPFEKTWRVQSIEVKVKRSGAEVRHRTGFVPLPAARVPRLVPVAAPLPLRGLRLSLAPALVSHVSRSPTVVVPFTILDGVPEGSDATFLVMAVDEKGRMRAQASGRLPRGITSPQTAPRLTLGHGQYQIRLIVQGIGTGGTMFADLTVPQARASSAVCAGVLLQQEGAPVPSATHEFAPGRTAAVHATVSLASPLDATVVTLASAVGTSQTTTVPATVSPAGRGWWRLESSVVMPTEAGRYRLAILSGAREVEGCSTELDVRPS